MGDLKKCLNKYVEYLNKSVKTLDIQSDINNLKKEASAVYAEIGKRAVAESWMEKYEELGEKLMTILAQIKEEEENLPADAVKEEKNIKICPGCSTENATDARFCSCCGEIFEDQNS